MPFTDAVVHQILNYYLRAASWTPPGTLYVGLSTTTPNSDGSNFTEPVGAGYGRVSLASSSVSWGAASGRLSSSQVEVLFPTPTGSWATLTHVGFFTAVSGGVLQAYEALETPRTVDASSVPVRFRIGDLRAKFPAT